MARLSCVFGKLLVLTAACFGYATCHITRRRAINEQAVVVVTIDGCVHILDAWTGEIRGVFTSGGPVVSSSTQVEPVPGSGDEKKLRSSLVVPGLDGVLYTLGYDGHLRLLPSSAPDLVLEPQMACLAIEGDSVVKDEGCGLMIGEKTTKVFSLDVRKGLGSLVDGKTSSEQTMLLQRDEYVVRALDTTTAVELWNVTVAHFTALDMSPGDFMFWGEVISAKGDSEKEGTDRKQVTFPDLYLDGDSSVVATNPLDGEVFWRQAMPSAAAGESPPYIISLYGVHGTKWVHKRHPQKPSLGLVPPTRRMTDCVSVVAGELQTRSEDERALVPASTPGSGGELVRVSDESSMGPPRQGSQAHHPQLNYLNGHFFVSSALKKFPLLPSVTDVGGGVAVVSRNKQRRSNFGMENRDWPDQFPTDIHLALKNEDEYVFMEKQWGGFWRNDADDAGDIGGRLKMKRWQIEGGQHVHKDASGFYISWHLLAVLVMLVGVAVACIAFAVYKLRQSDRSNQVGLGIVKEHVGIDGERASRAAKKTANLALSPRSLGGGKDEDLLAGGGVVEGDTMPRAFSMPTLNNNGARHGRAGATDWMHEVGRSHRQASHSDVLLEGTFSADKLHGRKSSSQGREVRRRGLREEFFDDAGVDGPWMQDCHGADESSRANSRKGVALNEEGNDETNAAVFPAIIHGSPSTATALAAVSLQHARKIETLTLSGGIDGGGQHIPLVSTMRYSNEFIEDSKLGKGGFGTVYQCKNRLDGIDYAIKKIRLSSDPAWRPQLEKVLREVKILALLDHPNIVRYYQAWLERFTDEEVHAETDHNTIGGGGGGGGDSSRWTRYNDRSTMDFVSTINRSASVELLSRYGGDYLVGVDENDEPTRKSSPTSSREWKGKGGRPSLLKKSQVMCAEWSASVSQWSQDAEDEMDDDDGDDEFEKEEIFGRMGPCEVKESSRCEGRSYTGCDKRSTGEYRDRPDERVSGGDACNWRRGIGHGHVDAHSQSSRGQQADSVGGGLSVCVSEYGVLPEVEDDVIEWDRSDGAMAMLEKEGQQGEEASACVARKCATAPMDPAGQRTEASGWEDAGVGAKGSPADGSIRGRGEGNWNVRVVEGKSKKGKLTDRAPKLPRSPPKYDLWLYIQMQYCNQQTLQYFLENSAERQQQKVDITYALVIFLQVAKGLKYVHSRGLIHRDLKPANCFLVDDNMIKIGDFGLSRHATNLGGAGGGDVIAGSGGVGGAASYTPRDGSVAGKGGDLLDGFSGGVGTYLYASPEQISGRDYDEATDVYSLGVMLFEMCYPTFSTFMEKAVVLSKARLLSFPEGWHLPADQPGVFRLIEDMLQVLPSRRPTTADIVKRVETMQGKRMVLQLDSSTHANYGPTAVVLRVELSPDEASATGHLQDLYEAVNSMCLECRKRRATIKAAAAVAVLKRTRSSSLGGGASEESEQEDAKSHDIDLKAGGDGATLAQFGVRGHGGVAEMEFLIGGASFEERRWLVTCLRARADVHSVKEHHVPSK